MHPNTKQCIQLLTHPLTHPLIHPFTHSSTHSAMHPTTHPFIHPLSHAFIHSSIYPFTHPSIHPLIHSSTHPSFLSKSKIVLLPSYFVLLGNIIGCNGAPGDNSTVEENWGLATWRRTCHGLPSTPTISHALLLLYYLSCTHSLVLSLMHSFFLTISPSIGARNVIKASFLREPSVNVKEVLLEDGDSWEIMTDNYYHNKYYYEVE